VYRYFCDWSRDGTLDRVYRALYVKCREKLDLEARRADCRSWRLGRLPALDGAVHGSLERSP